MKQLVELIYTPLSDWDEMARASFASALSERYARVTEDGILTQEEKRFQVRVNASQKEGNVPFAAILAPDQERSGAYGGMSFVLFPSHDPGAPALVSMGVGTHGLSPDEDILGRPGHARKLRSIAAWLRRNGPEFSWTKQDPVRIDLDLPKSVREQLANWEPAIKRYGKVLYSTYAPSPDRTAATDERLSDALTALIDLFFDERGIFPLSKHKNDSERIRRGWLAATLPTVTEAEVANLLKARRFVVLEGPPGTGKSRTAINLLRDSYKDNGRIIQFHPGTTYESFIGGLFPEATTDGMGFRFTPRAGHLISAASEAAASDAPYLLVIDEVNRADLAKVLGEAIYLFEPGETERAVVLPHEFPEVGNTLQLPRNLHVLGTMNSADRSIAILDLAVRRRFAFASMWPQLQVVELEAGPRMQNAFHDLLLVFLEHASDEAFTLFPGHAYFLADDAHATVRIETEIVPLLHEYLRQGYVASFADEVQAWIDSYAGSSD